MYSIEDGDIEVGRDIGMEGKKSNQFMGLLVVGCSWGGWYRREEEVVVVLVLVVVAVGIGG